MSQFLGDNLKFVNFILIWGNLKVFKENLDYVQNINNLYLNNFNIVVEIYKTLL